MLAIALLLLIGIGWGENAIDNLNDLLKAI